MLDKVATVCNYVVPFGLSYLGLAFFSPFWGFRVWDPYGLREGDPKGVGCRAWGIYLGAE